MSTANDPVVHYVLESGLARDPARPCVNAIYAGTDRAYGDHDRDLTVFRSDGPLTVRDVPWDGSVDEAEVGTWHFRQFCPFGSWTRPHHSAPFAAGFQPAAPVRAGVTIGRESLRARGPQDNPLSNGQPVLFLRQHEDRNWEAGTFLRYGLPAEAVVMADGQEVRTTRSRVVAAVPADLDTTLAAKRAETEPVWLAGTAGWLPGYLQQRLDRILARPDVDVTLCESVTALVRDAYASRVTQLPADEPARSGRPERPAPAKMTPRGPITVPLLLDALCLTGVVIRMSDLEGWTYSQRVDAYDWAMRMHLAASDNEVTVPDRPPFVPAPESQG